MSAKTKDKGGDGDLRALVDVTKTTQALVTHLQSSLAPSAALSVAPVSGTQSSPPGALPSPLEAIKATATLLRSHTTTLSLLLLTPPFTPSAVSKKIGEISSSALTGMVAVATSTPQAGRHDELGNLVRAELRAQVRRLLGTWGDVLVLILRLSERRSGKAKEQGLTESEKQDVLAATGVVWKSCDVLLKTCTDGVVGLVVKKADEWRGVLMDAVEELKEWGEDVDDVEDKAEGSDEDDDDDDIFGPSNKLAPEDKELKELLDMSIKKLKLVGTLYLALAKRRLKTFSTASSLPTKSSLEKKESSHFPMATLEALMALLKEIPETVDDLASGFYDKDCDEAKETLDQCCSKAKSAIDLVKQDWSGNNDEFTEWSRKWVIALETA